MVNVGAQPLELATAYELLRTIRDRIGASAATIFLLDPDGDSLQGYGGEWDWIRTSFASALARWPTVRAALGDGAPRLISAKDAQGAEAEWFEHGGIGSSFCVPLRMHAANDAVLFVDFDAVAPADYEPSIVQAGARIAEAIARSPARPLAWAG